MPEGRRTERVAEAALREVSKSPVRDLRDPRLRGSTLTAVRMDDYLRHVDTCTEDGNPPLAPPDHDARAAFVNPTGLLDYSVTAYIALKFPNGRPCAQ